MQSYLVKRISELVQNAGKTEYRTPLVGFIDAQSSRFQQLQTVAHTKQLLPADLLPEAQTVVAFFLPFAEPIIKANRDQLQVAREWATAYIKTNSLINDICVTLQADLVHLGVNSAFAKATHNFDQVELISYWSHKHVAWAAGLGTFGLNHLLITPAGCAGRFGSLVLDKNIGAGEPELRTSGCLYKQGKKCAKCVELCPSKALTPAGLDKARCYQQLLEVDRSYPDLGLCDVCGKCSLGPCATQGF